MARFKVHLLGLVTVGVIVIGLAVLSFGQFELMTAQAAQDDSIYVVKAGDSLFSIAKRFGVTTHSIAEANNLAPHTLLYRKQELIIPSAGMSKNDTQPAPAESVAMTAPEDQATPTPVAEAGPTEAATEKGGIEAQSETIAAAEAAPAPTTPAVVTYKVRAGDSIFGIAKKFGISTDALRAANGLAPHSLLYKNQVLIIPVPSRAAPVALPLPGGAATEATAEPTEAATEEATDEAMVAPTAEATEEATAAAWVEATAEPTEEMTAEPTAEATDEATEEATTQPTEEASQESLTQATAEPTEEAVVEPTAEATAEATAEPTAEATEEAIAEATAEPTEETTAEPTAETTDEAVQEATAQPTEEPTEEPTAEPTEEPTAEPTAEATDEAPGEAPSAAADILDTVIALGNFSTLLEMLGTAGLTETLKTEGPFTFFAPTNAAFAALPEGTVAGLLASSPDDLSQILLYHLVQGEISSADLADGTTLVTAQGATLTVSVSDTGIKINNANITITDLETSNGIIHVIDAVLLPSGSTAAAPIGAAAPTSTEAASGDAASVIIVTAPVTDATAAAQLWEEPTTNIALFSPVANGGYHSPIEIIGLSRTAEGTIAVNLVGSDGNLLAQRMTLGGAEKYAFFHTDVRFYVPDNTEATLNVLEMDMADGSILSTLETPLTLLPGQRLIDVTSPAVGQAVCDPILVSGYSNTFEANVVLTLRDPSGQTLAQLPTLGGTLGTYRDFATPLPYTVSAATPLLLSVTETDASGLLNTIDETVIPVTLYPAYSAACY
ncbi:MAG: fasciclin domain-containing protein [Caldilineaceae bacterium]|nr:fasciclin domain-containing protein [Caldilineaceae bacterium]